MATIARQYFPGQPPIVWKYDTLEGLHSVQYGLSFAEKLDDVEAAREFGECVRHAAECAGKFD